MNYFTSRDVSIREAAKFYNIDNSHLCKLIRSNSSFKGKGKKSGVFSEEEEAKMVRTMMERSDDGANLTHKMVKQVVHEEAELIKINEPYRKTFELCPETGEVLIRDHFFWNFLQRHELTKHLTSIKMRDSKEKPYECVICHRKFHFKNCLVTHCKNVHKEFLGVLF